MFNLDELDLDLNDEIFDILPKKLKTDVVTSEKQGILSFGIGTSVTNRASTQSCTQSSFSSPPNILSHINNERNIKECKKIFSNASKVYVKPSIVASVAEEQYLDLSQSPSYSPITSTQKPNDRSIHCLFDKTNSISPIRMRPGILREIRNVKVQKTFNQTTKTRKFPGPAGCLPNIGPDGDLSKVNLDTHDFGNEQRSTKNIESCMNPYDDFNTTSQLNDSDAWKAAKTMIGIECLPIFEKYRLENVLDMITRPNGLPNFKIPVTCLSLLEIEYLPRDAAATMTDITGSIKVAIHRQVLQQYRDKIKSGSVFILKKVSVFSPSGKKYFLNITESNVVDIVSPGEMDDQHHHHLCPIMTRQCVERLVDECNCESGMDFGERIVEKVEKKNTEQGTIDFFDDDMDQEFASLMDESFPS